MPYRLEVTATDDQIVRWFDTADEAMGAVNCLRATSVEAFIIYDPEGWPMSVGELAAIVIEYRLQADHTVAQRF